jgi:hypothetical protein
MTRRALIIPIAVLAAFAASCATNKPATPSPMQAGSHDMASMPDHDMSAMGPHSSSEMAFLFPDGDDRGWSKIENGTRSCFASSHSRWMSSRSTRR